MARWIITQRDDVQTGVDSLEELQALARSGQLSAGDMVQPPDSTEWIYASEIPEIKGLLAKPAQDDDDELVAVKSGSGGVIAAGLAVLFAGVAIVGAASMFVLYQSFPKGDEGLFTGDNALSFSQMIATSPAILHKDADAASPQVGTVAQDAVVELLAKRKDHYRIRLKDGTEGWVGLTDVLPLYMLGDEKVRLEKDPLYNPDRFVTVGNANWMQVDVKNQQATVFRFELLNQSAYPMTDVVLQATIKDTAGKELEKVEIALDGVIPPHGGTMVGTLAPETADTEGKPAPVTDFTYTERLAQEPELESRYSDGIVVDMSAADFAGASIDIIELRAIPPEG